MIDEEDISKTVESEMELFERVLSKEDKEEFLDIFRRQTEEIYRIVSDNILVGEQPNIYYSDLFVSGVIARSQNLMRGTILGIEDSNRYLVPQCQRALMETLALVNYVDKNPDYLENSIVGSFEEGEITNVKTMIKHLDRKHEGVKQDYAELSNHVHPNPESLMSNAFPQDKEGRFDFAYRAGEFSEKEIQRILEDVRNMNSQLIPMLRSISFVPSRHRYLKNHIENYELEWRINDKGKFVLEEES